MQHQTTEGDTFSLYASGDGSLRLTPGHDHITVADLETVATNADHLQGWHACSIDGQPVLVHCFEAKAVDANGHPTALRDLGTGRIYSLEYGEAQGQPRLHGLKVTSEGREVRNLSLRASINYWLDNGKRAVETLPGLPLYYRLRAAFPGVPFANHFSDLYIENKGGVVSGWLRKHAPHVCASTVSFQNLAEGGHWLDISLAFSPYWEKGYED